jgi:hypothetical protein
LTTLEIFSEGIVLRPRALTGHDEMEVNMSKFAFSAVAAGLIGGAMMLTGATPASAATLPSPAVVAPGDTAMVEEVRRHRADRPRRWDRRAHGPRYRYARPGFRHHHGGYYYSSPWWTGPAIGFGLTFPGVTFGLTAPYGHAGLPSAHVHWCMNRYRTYNPTTNLFYARVGVQAHCRSPYWAG